MNRAIKRHIAIYLMLLPCMATAKLQGIARIDSLVKELTSEKWSNRNDTDKVLLLDDLAYGYKTIDPDAGIRYALMALKLATELKWNKGIANANAKLGLNYQFKYDYPRALAYNLKALTLYNQLQDMSGVAMVRMSLGNVYSQTGDYAKGLEYDMSALKIFEANNDKKNIAITQGNIGNIYQQLNDYTQALVYDMSALKSSDELDDKSGIARNLGNIGNIYLLLGEYAQALEYNINALKIFEELGEKNGQGLISGNIGELYLKIATDSSSKSINGKHIPKTRNEQLKLAIQYLERGTKICKEISVLGGVIEFGQQLAIACKMAGKYKDALRYSKEYTAIKDSLYSQQNIQKIATIDGEREKEIKEKELQVQQLQLIAGKNEKRYYIAGLSLLLLVSAGLFRRFRTARKTRTQLEEKNSIIEAEKENAHLLRIRAERSEKFKQEFLTNMSHEIRTPMNAVNGMTDLLLDKSPRPDQLQYLQVISRSSDILLHIINDILDHSKIEAGKLELENIHFSLSDAVKQVKETLIFRAEEKELQLITAIDPTIPAVLTGDPYRLNQILGNLIDNAIKYTENGTVDLNVLRIKSENKQHTLLFKVTDTGIGIPKEKMTNLFDSFNQMQRSESRIYGTTGLGLSISKHLIELQGGNISAESDVGRGTTFTFQLTYTEGSAELLQQRTTDEQVADGTILNGLRILLADDNDYNRMVATETLHPRADVVIDEATNGKEAIEMLLQNDYDVILMDIQMPVMNGLDAARYIRNEMREPKCQTPIIALTASLLRNDEYQCKEAGMNGYLSKPFKAWQLIAALAAAAGRKHGAAIYKKQPEPKEIPKAINIPKSEITDLSYLVEFCEGNIERMKKFILVYVTSVPVFTGKIKMAMESNDKKEIARQIHALKPRWMMMGMKQTTDLGIKIEQQIKEQTDNGLEADITLLLAQAQTSESELRKSL